MSIALFMWDVNSTEPWRRLAESSSGDSYIVYLSDSMLSLRVRKTSLSYSTAVILQAIANGYLYGFDIIDTTGLPGGTVYPALRRLDDAGHLTSKWEPPSIAQAEPRPPRRYYELTRAGREALGEALRRYRLLEQTQPTKRRESKPSRA
jgi:PadR family transcriptional regulator PadR